MDVKFPDNSKDFPVPLPREFGRNTLIHLLEIESPARLAAQINEISLYFPGYQGILPAETCSLRPRSTATQSRVFRLSPEMQRTLRKKRAIARAIGVGSLSRDLSTHGSKLLLGEVDFASTMLSPNLDEQPIIRAPQFGAGLQLDLDEGDLVRAAISRANFARSLMGLKAILTTCSCTHVAALARMSPPSDGDPLVDDQLAKLFDVMPKTLRRAPHSLCLSLLRFRWTDWRIERGGADAP